MPHKINWEKQGVYSQFEGEVSGGELFRYVTEVNEDSRLGNCRYFILDFGDSIIVNFSMGQMDQVSSINFGAALYRKGSKAAFIARNQGTVAVVRKYIELMEEMETPREHREFRLLSDARAWIQD